MDTPFTYNNRSIEKLFKEQFNKKADYMQPRFKTYWPRSLEQDVLGIVRGYQRLRQLYNPDRGSHIQHRRDAEYANRA